MISTVYGVRWKVFVRFLQTVKYIVGSAKEELSVHFTVLNEESATYSSHIICIYLFITNNICKNSVKRERLYRVEYKNHRTHKYHANIVYTVCICVCVCVL